MRQQTATFLLLITLLAPLRAAEPGSLEFFERKVRPVLAERCYECHSATSPKLKGGLRVDSRQRLLQGGDTGPALNAAHPDQSLLITAIEYKDQDLQMPPKGKLEDQQIADLTAWIRAGATWPEEPEPEAITRTEFNLAERRTSHWAWQPVRTNAPPPVKDQDWPLQPTDRFLLARLEASQLKPAPDADRNTLIRRLHFDLTGLPPDPAQVRAFLEDPSPKAYETVVDELLASPHFGERWARHWLDLVRYAETLGHEFDYTIHNAWQYRDYVIRALNADVPYNLFAEEQIAGDLLPNPRRNPARDFNESIIGTGFYWLGQQVHSPVHVREHQAETIENQIDVLSKTFLGLTVACARCHDHKFDAISTRDFYSMYGMIASSRYTQPAIDDEQRIKPRVERLQSLQQQIRKAVAARWQKQAADLSKYLSAAAEVLHGSGPATDAADRDIVFEDFEKPDYEGWTARGGAFGSGPQSRQSIAPYQGDVMAVGRGFINSHDVRSESRPGDQPTGTLTSPEFVIQHDYIHFLIGGGNHAGKTCVNLLVDDTVVRTATGPADNRLRPHRFHVTGLAGKKARIVAVDEVSGAWGNIGLDHIVFSRQQRIFDDQNQPLTPQPSSALIAKRQSLDPAALDRWVKAVLASRSPNDPLYAWARITSLQNGEFKDRWRTVTGELGKPEPRPGAHAFLGDFTKGGFDGWITDGFAFGSQPGRPGDFFVTADPAQPVALLTEPAADTRLLSSRLQGSLRSPTFSITNRYLHLRVAGKETRLNVVIDNFTIIRNPIYGSLKQTLNNDELRWRTIDLGMWLGHSAYLELMDVSVGDPSEGNANPDGWAAITHAVLSPDPNHPPGSGSARLDLGNSSPGSIEELAGLYERELITAVGRWSEGNPVSNAQAALLALLDPPSATGTGTNDGPLAPLVREYRESTASLPEPTRVPGMTDGTGVDGFVFVRGNPRTPGERVPRRFLEALDPTPFEQGSGRLEFARQVTDPANPLTARVAVNRIWHHLFGRGIVPTPDDFGVLGTPPTHPELLDWLAHHFRTDAQWSVKKLVRLLVTSRAYRMSSQPADPAAEEKDPANELLHRMPVRRLEGESIRDSILAVSGRLDRKLFGPSTQVHITPFMEGRGRPGQSGPLDGEGRRSIYVEVRRNFLSPMMLAFDTPTPFTTIGRRTSSNVPAQALIMMNDPMIREQATLWARRVVKEPDPRRRVIDIYETALSRPPRGNELEDALAFIDTQTQALKNATGTAAEEEEVWADLCHVIYNVKEFVFLN